MPQERGFGSIAWPFNINKEITNNRHRAFRKNNDPITEIDRFFQIVGDHECGKLMTSLDSRDIFLNHLPGVEVKCYKWLIKQKCLRWIRNGLRKSDTLPHASRKLGNLETSHIIKFHKT